MSTPLSHTTALTVSTPVRKRSAGWRTLAGTVAALGLYLAAVPSQAIAAPCGPLLQSLVTYLTSGVFGANVDMRHTTNYQAHGYWDTADTYGSLSRSVNGPILRTETPRFWADGHTDFLTIEFYANGSVRFNGIYGPYPTQCYGNKFLTVNTGDSFETFTFEKNVIVIF